MMSNRLTSVALAALMLAAPVGAMAQSYPDLGGSPIYGKVHLSAGFTPDPHEISILPGGNIDIGHLGPSCNGFVGRSPDYQVEYSAGALSLNFRVEGSIDTSLVINGPSGQWLCDDDSGGNLDPLVTVLDPASGRYDIWIGTMGSGVADGGEQVRLLVTELDNVASNGTGRDERPDVSGDPVFGSVSLRSGFVPDPHEVRLTSGGSINASVLNNTCVGRIGTAPDYQLDYTAGSSRLTFKVTGKGDTTLVINKPDGSWVCDDDSGGNQNPRVSFKAPQSGRYDIWVGDFRDSLSSGIGDAVLQITEVD